MEFGDGGWRWVMEMGYVSDWGRRVLVGWKERGIFEKRRTRS